MIYVTPGMYLEDPDADAICDAWDESEGTWLFNQRALLNYILLAAQAPSGGLRDKPSAKPDQYHTCYVLSGLSIASRNAPYSLTPLLKSEAPESVNDANLVATTNPVYNIPPQCLFDIQTHFRALSPFSPSTP